MHLHELNRHRRSIGTRSGDVSAIDVGTGRVALFVHGIGTNAFLWRNVVDHFQAERRCVAIDLPLHGQTPARPDQDFSMGALAELIEDVCDGLALTNVDLVANDTGGGIAQIFAARHPDRLATFTLTNCETHDNVPPPAFAHTVWLARLGVFRLVAGLLRGRPALARKLVFGSGYEHLEHVSLEVIRAYLDPVMGTPQVARQFNDWLGSMNPRDLLAAEPLLQQLNVPTLVVWGTGDVFFHRRWAYWLKSTIPGVTEVVELDGARLFFPNERADELAVQLRRHWATHPVSQPIGADDVFASPATSGSRS
jgi:pimeloyl-ACP methyl ester carboxylesterase